LYGESVIAAAGGGGVGCALATAALRAARALPPSRLPRANELTVDARVLLIALAAAAVTALACGLWPALRATQIATPATLRAGSHGAMASRRESRLRRGLVVVQFALALTVLIGAALLLQSFRRAASVDVGFDPRDVLAVRLDPPAGAYPGPADAAALYSRLLAAVRAVPGVADAAFINHAPFGGASILTPVEIEGGGTSDTASRQVFYRTISDEYFRTLGATIAAGRGFAPGDMRSPGGAFVINQTMAAQYWPGRSAVGHRLTIHRSSQARPDFGRPLAGVVIGVVADIHQVRQDIAPSPEVYVPYTLETWPWGNLVIRTRDGARAIPALRRAIRGVDPRLIENGAVGEQRFTSLENAIASQLEPRRFSMRLITAFAACALLLAAIGLYGVMAYGVVQRRREIAVRKALGATDRTIATMLMRESLIVAALGAVAGVAGAVAGARLIRNLLFETGVADPAAYAATIVLLTITALVATYVPARAAMRMSIRDAL
jgi:predicted permease